VSALGPLLFLAYINDLSECVTPSETRLFADASLRSRLAVTTASYIPGTHYHVVQDYNGVVVVPDSPHSTS